MENAMKVKVTAALRAQRGIISIALGKVSLDRASFDQVYESDIQFKNTINRIIMEEKKKAEEVLLKQADNKNAAALVYLLSELYKQNITTEPMKPATAEKTKVETPVS